MTYDYELTLILPGRVEQDEIGNEIPVDPIETTILCDLKSVSRSEFYNAAATGLRPELVFVIHKYEYNGERLVEFDGKRYNVLRTYATGIEELELMCERVAANG
ncbi:phage head closure protein [Brevibacillus choshinensis]|uniref:phage head closure protein n=1 Tax=Brevibacillus choshinensis TaxID=54911 RepID=UPI002E21D506|nr:phage head closure protein [Brevibacillus choshinensis]MED4783445.1 phage head closure protein [Brevibacillus choshinensis]